MNTQKKKCLCSVYYWITEHFDYKVQDKIFLSPFPFSFMLQVLNKHKESKLSFDVTYDI